MRANISLRRSRLYPNHTFLSEDLTKETSVDNRNLRRANPELLALSIKGLGFRLGL